MEPLKKATYAVLILLITLPLPACKARKPLAQPPAAPAPAPTPEPVKPAAPAAEQKSPAPIRPATMALPPKPDYNFSAIRFEFNSAVLKTGAYTLLDKAAIEMKKDPTAKFMLNGYASAEGSAAHNLALSAQRANAVKTYLINAGVAAGSLIAKGYGEANPISANTDEQSRAVNRRVELKKM